MKVVDYMVIRSTESADDVEEMVRVHLADGWQPFGGIAFTDSYSSRTDTFFPTWAQAMVKYERAVQ